MAFVQMIEIRTTDIEAAQHVDEQWRHATEGRRTLRREVLARDRNEPDRYVVLAFFDSYESAMENSALPETQASANQYQKLSDDPPVFRDLDVIQDLA